ncbi:MAG: hypothetical protein WCF36_11935 [Candidatus Nanopelagicales bacterium]
MSATDRPPRTEVTPDPVLDFVESRMREVAESLTAATGGLALCRIEGAGGTAKHLEGRTAALMAARRLLRKDPDADLTGLRDQWRADQATHRHRGSSAAWLAYLEGGCAELDHLLAGAPTRTAQNRHVTGSHG